MNRGNRKAAIFEDERDRRRFLRIWTEQQSVFGVKTLGGCLMHNHFHEVVETPHGNLSEFMQQVDGQFARYSNWRHQRVGHLFQGRFRDVLIEDDVHLLTALCYVFLNPVAACICETAAGYKWSTYAATAGYSRQPDYLSIDWLSVLCPAESLAESQRRLRRIMETPNPSAANLREDELSVSPESIRQVIQSHTGKPIEFGSLPRMYRTALRPALTQLILDRGSDVDQFIWEARVSYGYKIAEIARALGISKTTTSAKFCRYQRRHSSPTISKAS